MRLPEALAAKAATFLGLTKAEELMLSEVPMRGQNVPMPPTDPLLYRFYELIMVNGPAWKELIQEEFGDGIMSAIDFDMSIERQPDPKGDRVKIAMTGKIPAFQILRRRIRHAAQRREIGLARRYSSGASVRASPASGTPDFVRANAAARGRGARDQGRSSPGARAVFQVTPAARKPRSPRRSRASLPRSSRMSGVQDRGA